MSLLDDESAGRKAITAERAAEVCFRDLGYTSLTNGAFRHEFMDWLWDTFAPDFIDKAVKYLVMTRAAEL